MYICIHSLRGYTMLPSMCCKFWVMEVRHGSIESCSRFRMLFNTALILLKVHSNAFNSLKPRWWFQISFLFTPNFGEDFQFDYSNIFSDGLKRPTRKPPYTTFCWFIGTRYPQFRSCRHFPTPLHLASKPARCQLNTPPPWSWSLKRWAESTGRNQETRKG